MRENFSLMTYLNHIFDRKATINQNQMILDAWMSKVDLLSVLQDLMVIRPLGVSILTNSHLTLLKI